MVSLGGIERFKLYENFKAGKCGNNVIQGRRRAEEFFCLFFYRCSLRHSETHCCFCLSFLSFNLLTHYCGIHNTAEETFSNAWIILSVYPSIIFLNLNQHCFANYSLPLKHFEVQLSVCVKWLVHLCTVADG